ncbi:MAG TPA: IclR family transcriptional regulator [Cellulomonas sp.]
MPAGANDERLVKSAQRTVDVLELLSRAEGPLTVADLHRITGYPRSSLHQLVNTLLATGWLERDVERDQIRIGHRALLCGTAYLDRDPALPLAVAHLEAVREEVGYTAHFARLHGAHVVYLATRETLHPRRASSRVGRELPAHTTALGKVLLAELSDDEVAVVVGPDPLESITPRTHASLPSLAADLAQVRTQGYAVEVEENTLGLSCVAVAIAYRLPATDAMSCSMPLERATPEVIEHVAQVLVRHATELAAELRRHGIR